MKGEYTSNNYETMIRWLDSIESVLLLLLSESNHAKGPFLRVKFLLFQKFCTVRSFVLLSLS